MRTCEWHSKHLWLGIVETRSRGPFLCGALFSLSYNIYVYIYIYIYVHTEASKNRCTPSHRVCFNIKSLSSMTWMIWGTPFWETPIYNHPRVDREWDVQTHSHFSEFFRNKINVIPTPGCFFDYVCILITMLSIQLIGMILSDTGFFFLAGQHRTSWDHFAMTLLYPSRSCEIL